jgi:hypothetical protein
MEEELDRHQLAGLDAKERGFSRPVLFQRAGVHYRAILRYETTVVTTEPQKTQDEALRMLIQTLQSYGYRQIRTQMSFRGGVYLGSQELWVEYPDPEIEPEPRGFFARLLGLVRPRATNEDSHRG